ncbi:hypothetical protein QBC40DRAFT_228987 [Triangularia verruculosa]|uniref:2-oxoadipate dioxygenase/decarboxylase n=1 Tax=Triangularia verruculosa TaxID=2587418 RepID=A0AAN6XG86_9PEZI|nr:hypothetical protein QBC40DRAFT_228987 [Triangularia verruculosa]
MPSAIPPSETVHHEEPTPWDPDHLRTRFVRALSDMYRAEVPLYGKLVDLVNNVDTSILQSRGQSLSDLPSRFQLERHGAIRLGTQQEMRMIGRLFALMGMYPVGYYDLKMVGFPLHGTAFRPRTEESLRKNPFRVFTTVLRPKLISSPAVREMATSILSTRQLFSAKLVELIDHAETTTPDSVKLTTQDADSLITESLKIFKWHSRSSVPLETYLTLKTEHPMVADIVCFPSAHINHLTPRTLDIDAVQAEMIAQGLPAKECIEGPPRRKCEILLRQTSFKALEERVIFAGGAEQGVDGTHTARFGEVEQRGAAVTRKGRELYDTLLAKAVRKSEREDKDADAVLKEVFAEYPDDWETLRKEELVYFRYRVAEDKMAGGHNWKGSVHMDTLLKEGVASCEPITYEDFLPFSAAGIFTSNLGGEKDGGHERKLQRTEEESKRSRVQLEELLGRTIPSEIDLYDELQSDSVKECETLLGLSQIVLEV